MNNNANNFSLEDALKMLSNMNQDQLEKGLSQASKVLNSPDADQIINQIRNKTNK